MVSEKACRFVPMSGDLLKTVPARRAVTGTAGRNFHLHLRPCRKEVCPGDLHASPVWGKATCSFTLHRPEDPAGNVSSGAAAGILSAAAMGADNVADLPCMLQSPS